MTKKQRAKIVQEELEKLYPEVPIPLDHKDAYTLMVAVALSAQTTDKKVNQIGVHKLTREYACMVILSRMNAQGACIWRTASDRLKVDSMSVR